MMKDTVNEQVIKEKNAKMKRSGNRFLIGFFIIFVAGYFFFFTSTVWLPASYEDIQETPIGGSVTGNDRDVTLISWAWDKEQGIQEIILEITNHSTDGIDTYEWSAMDVNKGGMTVEPVVNTEDFVVLHIKGIPPRWTEISLRMDAPGGDEERFSTMKFYTTKKSIREIGGLKTQSEAEYRLQAADSKMALYDKKITEIALEVKGYDNTIANAENRIVELSEKEAFQTDTEKSDTLEQIAMLESEKSEMIMKRESALADIKELQEKIRMQEKIKQSIKEGM